MEKSAMAGVLQGLTVLDLSQGISGSIATMLLSDHGATVTKIEPPGGDPFRELLSGYRVWMRGKRSAIIDLKTADGQAAIRRLASKADVLVESFAPGDADRHGLDYEALRTTNPRLVYCSITGYGHDGPDADRPALDALVAARTGAQWEHRGLVGGTIERISGGAGMVPGVEPDDDDCWLGPKRPGPMFPGVPWPSQATAYFTALAVSAALREREVSGVGQRVETSLMQGVLLNTHATWQRTERYDTPGFQSWITDPRAPRGIFKAADGRWIHHFVPSPSFILGVSEGDRLRVPEEGEESTWKVAAPQEAPMRIGFQADDMVVLHAYHGALREAVERFPADEWMEVGAKVGVPLQAIRSPEEALRDPALLADGCVMVIEDAEVGRIRQVGSVYRLSACPEPPRTRAPLVGEHTDTVLGEADLVGDVVSGAEPASMERSAPLAGLRVLDLGLAVAGPFGTSLLANLGAEVIKVNTPWDAAWFASHIAFGSNHTKRSIALDLKTEQGREAFYRLVESADIVQHNMRYEAAERLGVDYESLRAIKPDLIYCHTRGFERGPREEMPGNDQTGAALAGTSWLDGEATDDGGKPFWTMSSIGDTGNGLLSAIAMVQALYHRDRTGEGQFVETSILYAQLLNASMAWVSQDGGENALRPRLDRMCLGWGPLYRLYETNDDWLCIAAVTDSHWTSLCEVLGCQELTGDPRFADRTSRDRNRGELGDLLAAVFELKSASEWFTILDGAGVPCEVSNPDFVLDFLDDPLVRSKGWMHTTDHPVVGHWDTVGRHFDLLGSPTVLPTAPPLVGQHSCEILSEIGYSDAEIDELVNVGVALDGRPGAS